MVSHAAEALYTPQNIFLITLVLQNAVCFVADNYFLFKAFLHIYIYIYIYIYIWWPCFSPHNFMGNS